MDKTVRRLPALVVVLAISAAALAACNFPAPPTLPGQPLFRDDFSSTASGWKTSTTDYLAMDYDDGGFSFRLHEPHLEAWSTPGVDLVDLHMEADVEKTGGVQGTAFGLICRYQDPDHFYFFSRVQWQYPSILGE